MGVFRKETPPRIGVPANEFAGVKSLLPEYASAGKIHYSDE